MKWKSKPVPKQGTKRTRKVFALLPVYSDTGLNIWLEYVDVVEIYDYHGGYEMEHWGWHRISVKEAGKTKRKAA